MLTLQKVWYEQEMCKSIARALQALGTANNHNMPLQQQQQQPYAIKTSNSKSDGKGSTAYPMPGSGAASIDWRGRVH